MVQIWHERWRRIYDPDMNAAQTIEHKNVLKLLQYVNLPFSKSNYRVRQIYRFFCDVVGKDFYELHPYRARCAVCTETYCGHSVDDHGPSIEDLIQFSDSNELDEGLLDVSFQSTAGWSYFSTLIRVTYYRIFVNSDDVIRDPHVIHHVSRLENTDRRTRAAHRVMNNNVVQALAIPPISSSLSASAHSTLSAYPEYSSVAFPALQRVDSVQIIEYDSAPSPVPVLNQGNSIQDLTMTCDEEPPRVDQEHQAGSLTRQASILFLSELAGITKYKVLILQ
jgi:hypothetical protein